MDRAHVGARLKLRSARDSRTGSLYRTRSDAPLRFSSRQREPVSRHDRRLCHCRLDEACGSSEGLMLAPRTPDGKGTMGAGTPLTYAIGDIHGRLDLLTTLLAQIEQHRAERDRTIVLLGDYIDRGPDSAGVIATVRK